MYGFTLPKGTWFGIWKVDNDKVYEARGKKIDTLWDDRNKLLGWIAGISVVAGSAGGGIAYLLNSLSKVMAR